MKIEDFRDRGPALVVERFFDGELEGHGLALSRFGSLQRLFFVRARGRFDPAEGVLHLTETYTYDDGQVDELHWTIRRDGAADEDGVASYEGEEVRVAGAAVGRQAGNAFHWKYKRNVPDSEGGESLLSFDDWFWLQDERSLVVQATISKIVEIGTMTVFYRRL